jgi:hypothetical protein
VTWFNHPTLQILMANTRFPLSSVTEIKLKIQTHY